MRKILLLVTCCCLFVFAAYAQVSTISTKGREFWFSFMQMIPNGNIQYQIALTSETNAQATIRIPGINYTNTVNIVPGITTQVNLTNPFIIPNGEGLRNTGIQVTATADISVFATYQSNARTESTIVLPVQALGSNSEYIVTTIAPQSANGNSNLVIAATQDNTVIEIIPSAPTLGGRAANVPFQITLNAGQSYQIIGANVPPGQSRPDLTGTVIRSVPGTSSCKPFAVFAGVTATIITTPGCFANSLQHLWEQQYPVSTWGTRYALTPYTNDRNIRNRGYIFRITASQDNTRITLNNGAAPQTITLNRGQSYTAFTGTFDGIDISRGVLIEADKPISVAQVTLSQACNGSSPQAGDPSLLMLTPLNQATTRVTVTPARMFGGSTNINPQNERHFINVLMRTAATASFRITSPTGSFAPFAFQPLAADPSFSYAVIEIGTGFTIPSYTLQSSGEGFGAFIYGYNGPDAYAYAAAATFENQEVNFNVVGLPACGGTPLTFTGRGTGVTNFEWDFGDGSPVQRGQTVRYTYPRGGIFNVRMRATTGTACGFTDIVKEVQVIEQPRPDLGKDTTICNNNPILLSGGGIVSNPSAAQLTYQWSSGATTPTITVNQPGRYILTVTNFGQCIGRDTIVVSQRLIQNDLGQDQTVCANIPVPLGFAPQQGINYQWTPATGLSNDKISNPTFTPENTDATPRTVRYILHAIDPQTNCSKSDTINITIRPNLLQRPATPQPTLRLCAGERAQIGTASGIAGVTYSWSPATGLSDATAARPFVQIDNLTADSVQIRYIQTLTLQGCSYRDTVTVIVYRRPVANAGRDTVACSNRPVQLGSAPQSGLTYRWLPLDGLSNATVANPMLRLTNSGTTAITRSYILTVRNAAGCTSTDTVNVRILPGELPPSGRRTIRLCHGDTTQIGLDSVQGFTYRWSPATGLSSSTLSRVRLIAQNTTADSLRILYVLTISNGACTAQDTTEAIIFRRPVANAGQDQLVCAGQTVTIGAAPVSGLRYQWTPAEGLSNANIANPTIRGENPGNAPLRRNYILRVSNAAGCFSTDTVQVTILPPLNSALTTNLRVCSADTLRLGAAPVQGYIYRWSPAANLSADNIANPVFRLNVQTRQTLTYILTTTANNCSATDTVRITVEPRFPKLKISGETVLCPGANQVRYRLDSAQAGVLYAWTVTGGSIQSGQGTREITVNWGALNPEASIVVGYADPTVCNSGGDTLRVRLTLQLPTGKISTIGSRDTLCVNRAQNIRYQVRPNAGSVFTWQTSAGGTIVSGQGSNAVTVNWTSAGLQWLIVTERLTTPLSTCTGISDTLRVLINPAPDATLQIQGAIQTCENSRAVYSLAGFLGSRYEWIVTGGIIQSGQGTREIVVQWGKILPIASFQPQVRVREISGDGCEGELITLPVRLLPIPVTRLVASDSVFCPTRTQGLRYAVSGAQGSTFTWQISGGTITQTTDNQQQITVNWDTLAFPKRLSVIERSAGNCEGQPLVFNIYYDNPQMEMRNVSVQQANERNIEVQFRIRNAVNLPQTFAVSRRPLGQTQWIAAGTVRATDSLFTDLNLTTDESAYEYRLERQAVSWGCNINPTAVHNSIWLRGTADEATSGISLNWNNYGGWRVGQYEIWRKLDNETDFRLLTTVNGNTLQFNDFSGKEGFTHCFRILAREAGGSRRSWSNDICLNFTHPITVPNVITPNGDGRNETFVIPNLEPYKENELFIYNRYHQLIYSQKNYQQNWNGDGHPSGTYYYLLRAFRPTADGQTVVEEFKGWLQVLRE
jgi:gliding motility-associated-like protein